VRPFNTFGPRQSARAVIPAIISQIMSGRGEVRLEISCQGATSPLSGIRSRGFSRYSVARPLWSGREHRHEPGCIVGSWLGPSPG
jgi:hypothetical protein